MRNVRFLPILSAAAMATAAQEPLGTLLVKRGLISEEQLAEALADQKETGEPLGKIVVDRGFTRPEVIAQALATQHGGLLKTEYGFATGFGAGLAPPVSVAAPPVTAGAVATAPAEAPPAVVSPPAELRNELAHASEEAERLRTENERLAQLRTELEQRLANESQKLAALERELASANESSPANSELEKQIAHEVRRIATLEAEIAARDEAIAEFKETGESWKKALVERDDAIRQLVSERNDALVKLEAVGAAAPAPDTAELDELKAQLDEVKAELDARAATIAQLEQAVESANTVSDDTTEIDLLREDLAAREQAFKDIELARDKALKQIAELEASRNDALAQLRAAKADLAERDAKLPELSSSRDAALDELQAVRVALEGRDAAIADLVAKVEASSAPAPDRWAGAERHLLFFQGADGYELVERSGPPPRDGDVVQVPGGPMTVARLASSPTPGEKLPCAYLTA
jgi:DNA repair exonuclease SbcCD ATPase subunit